ncbi:TonB-dependent receptor [Variovorax ginsengisoli]|uniref:TonB-dependent receptor n=1 Tax=Variovorax ginsengisoli TaxID=363844 RepID=A0ABT8RWK0_9BURK|nr:TonB-dependent receptor [Variovorax ginsengisoli]MDN8611829.1 TonB-dependent receptor [Variovorax ginsengisoli]MDO1530999.1 TonB-dependent receptor [Variovorax ginsengisoli]
MKFSAAPTACLLLAAWFPALAQEEDQARDAGSAPTLGEITVSTPAGPTPLFDVAGSVDRVEGAAMRDSRLGVNLSESLSGVPGLQIQNRQNYAQDLQISIRGFGARSTFGVRGVRLYVDGIPATLPDGQGQTSNIDIGSVDHVEVLRGPFSALYGNSSGGVVQTFTETGEGPPRLGFSMAVASFGTTRTGVMASGSSGAVDYLLSAGRFETDGYRDHSAAYRDIVNGKFGLALDDGSRLTLVANSVHLNAQDPLGLTAEQYALNRRSAAVATQFDTRKSVDQTQAGLTYERRLDGDNALRLMVYGGERKTSQYQAIPPSAQSSPTSAGGVIGLDRDFGGVDLRWISQMRLADRPFELVAGLEYNKLREHRTGYENFLGPVARPVLGVQGRLRRNEVNEVYNLDPYVQGNWRFADRWTLEAGVRRSSVDFDSQDHYIVGANGNDSGSARYTETLPVASLRYEATRDLALYTSVGRGFETPTLNELSYRPDGRGGLNFALQPAVNDSLEVGAKARLAGGLLTAALFKTRTSDEIVTATNIGGRATFQNAGRTTRDGFELAWQHETEDHWRTQLAYTWLDARYSDTFCATVPCTAAGLVPAGNRIPGIAPQALFASYGWVPPQGWRAGTELRALSSIEANDRNTVSAPGYAVVALFAGYVMQWQRWDLNAFARIDNLFDRQYIGSVIVNEGNARYYEPAPGRNWTMGLSAAYRF